MSNVAHDTSTSNAVAEGDASATPVVNNALPEATDAEGKALEDYQASEAKVVELAIQTLDPKDMLRKYARLGKEALSLAAKAKRPSRHGLARISTRCANSLRRS